MAAAVLYLSAGLCSAQALPTAVQRLQITAFAGATGTYTGLNNFVGSQGRNAGVTAGIDLGFLPLYGLSPSVEVRGTHVVDSGAVDGQSNLLAGLKVGRRLGRVGVYGDILVGRGSIGYGTGYQVPGTSIFYTQSHGNVISPGFGVDLPLTAHFSLKLDGQYQRYATPVTASGHLFAKAGTVGVSYRFGFKPHRPQMVE